MDFQTFAQSGRVVKCLKSQERLGLFDWEEGIPGIVFAGDVFLEFVDGSYRNGFRAEIMNSGIESTDVVEVVKALYEFACEVGYIGEEGGVRAEIGSCCIESTNVTEVVKVIYDFACEEGLLEEVE